MSSRMNLHLAGMGSGPELDPELGCFATELGGGAKRVRRGRVGREMSIPHRLDELPVMSFGHVAHAPIEPLEQLPPVRVAESVGNLRRTNDVGEEQRRLVVIKGARCRRSPYVARRCLPPVGLRAPTPARVARA
jgi:hypothetical protein